jgi:cytochrome bd-type quinol oxidase subunit 2
MGAAVIAMAVLIGLAVWVYAVVDLINATEMEQTGRLILAAVVIVAAPIGVLIWMGVRGGRVGALVAMSIGAVTVGVTISVLAASISPHATGIQAYPQVQQVFSGSVGNSRP